MRRADRLLQIVQVLRRYGRPVTGDAIAEELEISVRTLYRDIVSLQSTGVPIRGEAGVGYVLEEGYDLPPLMFNSDELEAVMMGLRHVQVRGDDQLIRTASDVIAKIAAVLSPDARNEFIEAPLYAPDFGVEPIPSARIELSDVRLAIRQQNKLRIDYADASGVASERIIWPLSLTFFAHSRMIVSWCELRQDFRAFRTDRVEHMDVMEERYRESRIALRDRWWKIELARRERAAADALKD
ncbi:YafY family protein [Pseudovibrio sp. Tun.PSC04-5.I4]|uniref:helix-turn-helix transcriptional regulator n=1 Tax=Pseudovibrio sp. Tun.PSC04-5.I4 TaxID=1798213 RepID=UPI0008923C52|nr:YafY family protein [Pseudovibrio sp. Tun.PSC04-5.I4]SDR33568.1 Predicted DNA-binding transcriptional regulator YafY, contains an HTH and WYL domains [Pseudovibrio sp. Tun.PSC04-5.I4]